MLQANCSALSDLPSIRKNQIEEGTNIFLKIWAKIRADIKKWGVLQKKYDDEGKGSEGGGGGGYGFCFGKFEITSHTFTL